MKDVIITTDPRTHAIATSGWISPEYHTDEPDIIPWRCRFFGHKWINGTMSEDYRKVYHDCARCPAKRTKIRGRFI